MELGGWRQGDGSCKFDRYLLRVFAKLGNEDQGGRHDKKRPEARVELTRWPCTTVLGRGTEAVTVEEGVARVQGETLIIIGGMLFFAQGHEE